MGPRLYCDVVRSCKGVEWQSPSRYPFGIARAESSSASLWTIARRPTRASPGDRSSSNSRHSARQIEPFVRKYGIDMSEFEPVDYRSFAEFFDRRFRPGARKFPSEPEHMGAFAEARYFAWERLDAEQQFPVKGCSLSAEHILGNAQRARPFIGGPVLLVRLAPVDYHHVHYPDNGSTVEHERLGGRLWAVNWHALLSKH